MNHALALLLRRTAQALRLVADVLEPIEPAVVHTLHLDGRKIAEAVGRNGGGPASTARR